MQVLSRRRDGYTMSTQCMVSSHICLLTPSIIGSLMPKRPCPVLNGHQATFPLSHVRVGL